MLTKTQLKEVGEMSIRDDLRNYVATQIGDVRCKITVNEEREEFDLRFYLGKIEALVDILEKLRWDESAK